MRSGLTILCGFGRVGAQLVKAVAADKSRTVVIVKKDEETASHARTEGLLTVFGDARDLNRLRVAGVGRASDVIVAVGDDSAAEVVEASDPFPAPGMGFPEFAGMTARGVRVE